MDALQPAPVQARAVLGISNEDRKEQESTVFALLQILSYLLSGKDLGRNVRRIFKADATLVSKMHIIFPRLVEQILILSDTTRSTRRLDLACNDVLGALLGLLPFDELLDTMRRLLERNDAALRRRVLRLLEKRLKDETGKNTETQLAALNFLPVLSRIIEETENTPLLRLAVTCSAHISRAFGKKDPVLVATAASIIAGSSCLGQDDTSVQSTGLSCLASMIEVLGERVIPLLPSTLSRTFELLQLSMTAGKESLQLFMASCALLSALLAHVPWMISDEYLDRILILSFKSTNSALGKELEAEGNRHDALGVLARNVDPALTFGALERTFVGAVSEGPEVGALSS